MTNENPVNKDAKMNEKQEVYGTWKDTINEMDHFFNQIEEYDLEIEELKVKLKTLQTKRRNVQLRYDSRRILLNRKLLNGMYGEDRYGYVAYYESVIAEHDERLASRSK